MCAQRNFSFRQAGLVLKLRRIGTHRVHLRGFPSLAGLAVSTMRTSCTLKSHPPPRYFTGSMAGQYAYDFSPQRAGKKCVQHSKLHRIVTFMVHCMSEGRGELHCMIWTRPGRYILPATLLSPVSGNTD
jgi:hypothetical protein